MQECANHQFQACNVNWSGRIDPDGNTYAWWHTGGDFNDSLYSNSQVDAWLDDARVDTDQGKRKQDYVNAQKQIVADAPYVFTIFGVSAQISSNKIHGLHPLPRPDDPDGRGLEGLANLQNRIRVRLMLGTARHDHLRPAPARC